ncbi:MAG TPA: metallophosphoesterase [Acidimicrobiales bacterium]|nr:metallophosphoesterase [Acidimicrobiales bacterium]
MPPELTTVSDDSAVLFDGAEVVRAEGLESGVEHRVGGVIFATLARPPGERLATVATVNDVHFGEIECGRFTGLDLGPVLTSEPGEVPYPELMSSAAAAEIAAVAPDAVVAKGDLTSVGLAEEYAAFEACYRPALGDRLIVTRGNHDVPVAGAAFACDAMQEVAVAGAVLAVVDTTEPGCTGGRLLNEQVEWLDELGARATSPVLVFGHHPCWQDRGDDWVGGIAAAINPADSARLVEVVARRPAIAGYFAGHTHRNRVRRFPSTGTVPFAEVACTKDFPGAWAEYRIFEGGVLQVHHRISSPAALEWSERCRALFAGLYPRYAFGRMEDRCFRVR